MQTLGLLLKNPGLALFVNQHSWVWPTCEIVHFLGMALLFGTVGTLDLRLLQADVRTLMMEQPGS